MHHNLSINSVCGTVLNGQGFGSFSIHIQSRGSPELQIFCKNCMNIFLEAGVAPVYSQST